MGFPGAAMTDSIEKRPRGPTPPRPEPVVGTRAYDLARWLLERTARFPARLLQRGERVLSTAKIMSTPRIRASR